MRKAQQRVSPLGKEPKTWSPAVSRGFNAVYLDNFVRPSLSPLPPRVELVCSGAPNPNLETCTPNQGGSKNRS